jgi:hypothetical protein
MKIGIEFLQPGIYRLFYDVLREKSTPDPAIIEHMTRTILHLESRRLLLRRRRQYNPTAAIASAATAPA